MIKKRAELYHNAYMEAVQPAISKLKPRFIVMNLIMYAIFLILLIVDYVWFRRTAKQDVSFSVTIVEKIIFIYTGSIYFITSIGFFFYGTRIHLKFSKLRINTQSRKKILTKIQGITYLISTCFIIRSVIIFWGTIWNLSADWYFDGIYYLVLEVIPILLMLRILHGDSKGKENGTNSKTSVNSPSSRSSEREPLTSDGEYSH